MKRFLLKCENEFCPKYNIALVLEINPKTDFELIKNNDFGKCETCEKPLVRIKSPLIDNKK